MAHRAESAIFEHRAMDVTTVKVTSRDIPPFRLAVTSDGSTDPGPRDPAAFLSPGRGRLECRSWARQLALGGQPGDEGLGEKAL